MNLVNEMAVGSLAPKMAATGVSESRRRRIAVSAILVVVQERWSPSTYTVVHRQYKTDVCRCCEFSRQSDREIEMTESDTYV